MRKTGVISFIFMIFFSSVITSSHIVTYENDIKGLLSSYCVSCHSWTGNYNQLMEKTSDESITSGKPIVEPEKPDESVLIWRLEGKLPNGNSIIRMPKLEDPLSAEDIQMVRTWIEQGAIRSPVGVEEERDTWGKVKALFR